MVTFPSHATVVTHA